MKNKNIFIGTVVALGLITLWIMNGLAVERQAVERSYAEIQIQLARQAEMLPNMVEIARGYAKHEDAVFTKVSEARAGVSAAMALKPADLASNPEAQKQFAEAIAAQSAALLKMQQTVEAYPALQANENFKTVMVAVEGCQNRIAIARKRNQDAIAKFNLEVVTYPRKIFASIAGYQELPFFTADATAQHAPTIKF